MRALVLVACLSVGSAAAAAKGGTTVVIDSPVAGATVDIDGRVVGKTPLRAQPVTPGSHVVRVRKLGFLEYSETIEIMSGHSITVLADLLPFAGVLAVRASPKDAQVTAIRGARHYMGDKLIRVAKPHRLLDPAAGPLIAVRLWILTRKTLGGLQTDLSARVLKQEYRERVFLVWRSLPFAAISDI